MGWVGLRPSWVGSSKMDPQTTLLCLWDSRASDQHYVVRDWPPRTGLTVGQYNVCHDSLILLKKVLLLPLHIKLGLTKQFVVALDSQWAAFHYIC